MMMMMMIIINRSNTTEEKRPQEKRSRDAPEMLQRQPEECGRFERAKKKARETQTRQPKQQQQQQQQNSVKAFSQTKATLERSSLDPRKDPERAHEYSIRFQEQPD